MQMRHVLALALTLVGCSTATEPTGPKLMASSIEVLGGDNQTDTVAQELPIPILVRVTDTLNGVVTPLKGQLVNFVVASGGGHVFAGSALTDSLGRAQERWTLGTGAGIQTLEARAVDPATGAPIVYATLTATGVAGAPAHLALDTALAPLVVDSVWNWRARIAALTDQYGNPRPVALAQAVAPALTLLGDSVRADSEADGWLHITAGALTDSLPWSARRELRGVWNIAYRCRGPKVGQTGNDGITPVDSLAFAGTAQFTAGAGGWTFASTMTVTRYLRDSTTETAPSGDVFPASQGIGTLTVGGELFAWVGNEYFGADFCGPSLWTGHDPVALTR